MFLSHRSLEAGQKEPEVWNSLCQSTATSETSELAEVPGIWADQEFASFRWSPVSPDCNVRLKMKITTNGFKMS